MRTTGDWSFGGDAPKLKPTLRGMADFGQMHFNWMRGVEQMGIDPLRLKTIPPIEMTKEEHDGLCFARFALGKMSTLFGHPVKISPEPVGTIPLPSRV